jgi:hypothetical protein
MKDPLLPLRTIADVKMLCTGQPACYLERWGLIAKRTPARTTLYTLRGQRLTYRNYRYYTPYMGAVSNRRRVSQ